MTALIGAILYSMLPDACFVIMIVLAAACSAVIATNVYEDWKRRQWEKPRRTVEDYYHE